MNELTFPEALKDLPVARAIKSGEIDPIGKSFALIAHTGSGKSICVPAVIAASGIKVILRQPTRQTAKIMYLGLKKFWDDQLSIGIHTSEEDEGSLAECDIMVCTDGVLKNWLKNLKYRVCVIQDEFHWMQAISEIEASIVKSYLNSNYPIDMVILSATIRPSNIIKYFENLNNHPVTAQYIDEICETMEHQGPKVNALEQRQWLKCFYAEGVAHPIEDRIVQYFEETPAQDGTIMEFARKMLEEEKRGLVFLCTRAEVQNTCNLIKEKLPDLPVEFAHADVKIDNIIKFVETNEPSLLFATVSLATSATLPFDEVLIIDKGIDTVYEHGIEKQVTDIPIDNNGVLQRRGRCGRTKPGICTLATAHEDRESWDDIRPTAIKPPLEKVAPIQAALVCAQYGRDPRYLDTLSNLDDRAISRSVKRLKSLGVVYEDEKEEGVLGLTRIGYKVATLPLEVELAVTVARCPDEILPIVIAIASCDNGIYGMFQQQIIIKDKKFTGSDLLDKKLINQESTLLTKAKIIQGAYLARADEEDSLTQWAQTNGLYPERMKKILFKFYNICKGMGRSENKIKTQLMEMDIDSYTKNIIHYLYSTRTLETTELRYDEYNGKGGFKGEHIGYFTILDSLDMKLMELDQRGLTYIHVMGNIKMIKSKKSNIDICIFADTTLLPPELTNDEMI